MYSNDEVSDLVQYDAEFYTQARKILDMTGCLVQSNVKATVKFQVILNARIVTQIQYTCS